MRSRTGYWIGGGLVVAGVAGAVLWFVISLVHISNEVDDFQRVPLPGKATMHLEARKYIVYYEDSTADEVVPSFEIAITDAQTGAPLAIAPYRGSLTYSFSGHEGSAQGTVTPPHGGAYAVRTDSPGRPTRRERRAWTQSRVADPTRDPLHVRNRGPAGWVGSHLARGHRRPPLPRASRTS